MKNPIAMLRQNKNNIKNIINSFQKKYLKTRHNFTNKPVKYLGVEAIKNLKHKVPQTIGIGKQLFKTEGIKNIQMNGKQLGSVAKRSVEYIHRKEFSSQINMVSKSKSQLPFLAGGGLMRLTEFNLTSDHNIESTDERLKTPPMHKMTYGEKMKVNLKDGVIYEGHIANGKMHGKGRLTWPNGGDIYIGGFINNAMHGKGLMQASTGNYYCGDINFNQFHGRGIYTYQNGDKFSSEWRQDVPFGWINIELKSGNQFNYKIKHTNKDEAMAEIQNFIENRDEKNIAPTCAKKETK